MSHRLAATNIVYIKIHSQYVNYVSDCYHYCTCSVAKNKPSEPSTLKQ
jgi:hypothetical protein